MTDTTAANAISNLSLSLEAIHLPPAPDFWPMQWGWWSLIAAVLITIVTIVSLLAWQKRRLRAKKAAVALIQLEKNHITPSGAMEIVRQAALSYYPRTRVAHLSGASWLTFLDSQVTTPIFTPYEQEWLIALYQNPSKINRDELISQCNTWLNTALPPKKGGRE